MLENYFTRVCNKIKMPNHAEMLSCLYETGHTPLVGVCKKGLILPYRAILLAFTRLSICILDYLAMVNILIHVGYKNRVPIDKN